MKAWRQIHHERLRALVATLASALGGGAPSRAPAQAARMAVPEAPSKVDSPAPQAVAQPQPGRAPAAGAPAPKSSSAPGPEVDFRTEPSTAALPPPPSDTPTPVAERAPAPPASQPAATPSAPSAPPTPGPSALPSAKQVDPAPRAASPALEVLPRETGGTARNFFAALGWGSGKPVSTAALQMPPAAVPSPDARPAAEEKPGPASCASRFFSRLPWDGLSAGPATLVVSVRASRDDSGLDPRTADLGGGNMLLAGMLSAARTSDRMAATSRRTPANAREFLSSLPWKNPSNPQM